MSQTTHAKFLVSGVLAHSLIWIAFPLAAQEYVLPDTGQTACFAVGPEMACPQAGTAFYGQDAQTNGTAMAYDVLGDGTVADLVTGLIWQQTPISEKVMWKEAQSYCEDLDLAGRSDWRTPSLKELFSISDFSQGWPYVDLAVFDLNGDEKDQQFWSSNFYEVGTTHGGVASAFGVNHVTGHIKAYPAEGGAMGNLKPMAPPPGKKAGAPNTVPPNAGKYVRCVSGDVYGENSFVDNQDGTVTDAATGLMWAQSGPEGVMDWEAALAYVQAQNAEGYLGHSDWRLPNIRELQSIVDYSGVFPAIDAAYFQATPDYYWSSTSGYFNPRSPSHDFAWYVAFGYAPGEDGEDLHGAGAVRFASKNEDAPAAEGDFRHLGAVRMVRSN